jgi:LmbE family N-acetylglucosaminyl deacetylase
MLDFLFNWPNGSPKILCLGAHSDDIELGCGGTLLNICSQNIEPEIQWVVFSANKERKKEAISSANSFLGSIEKKKIIVHDFKENYFPYNALKIKESFDELGINFNPDLIFTHYRLDLHQDHKLIYDLTLNTFRNHLVLEYEIPKYDGDLGSPHIFSFIDQNFLDTKIRYLIENFQTQKNKPWFSEETFRALPRLRGIESRSPSGYAEAFHCRKMNIAKIG